MCVVQTVVSRKANIAATCNNFENPYVSSSREVKGPKASILCICTAIHINFLSSELVFSMPSYILTIYFLRGVHMLGVLPSQ